MQSTRRFSRGSKAYTKDGRVYVVEEVEDGTVYCSLDNGTETEFAEASLMNEAEWAARTDGRRDMAYAYLKQSRFYTTPAAKVDRAAAEKLLTVGDRLIAGLLDYVAFTTAVEVVTEKGDRGLVDELSIVKCRKIFDAAVPEARVNLLARTLGLEAATLASASSLGENMARAMLEKGLEAHSQAFEDFCDRPRR
jgi:hypothetical protein